MTRNPREPAPESLEDLQESREWLRITLSSIGDGVITTDARGDCTFLNPVAEQLTGWTTAEAAGVPLERVFQIVNEDTRALVENPALRALREGLIVGLANHTLLIAKDGSEHPVDDSGAPIRNGKGQVSGVVLVFRDVTERREQEHKLQSSLDYARGIVATIRESLLVLDGELRVKSANRAFYETFRVSREETEGRLVYELGHGQWNIPKLRVLLEEILPLNHAFDNFEVEHEFPGIGHKVMWLNARRVQQGEELILLAIEDATERRDAQRVIHDSEMRYRRLFESAKDGILILDASTGRITDANPYVADLVGVAPQTLIGKELWEIGLFKDIEENKQVFRTLQEHNYVQYDNLPLRNMRGETVEVEFVSNVYREDHHLVAQCNVRNVAERRLREQASLLADENRRKDEFLAMLSHELRNPLAPIRSAVYLLRSAEPAQGDIQRQAYEILDRQVGNMTRLLSDLLEVSRAVSGRIRVELQPHDLRAIIHNSVETVQALIESRKHALELLLPETPVVVNVDPSRMEEVLVNLITNAAKYTPADGKGRITIDLGIHWNQAILRVQDNGEGIESDLLEAGRLFDLFTQGTRSLDRSQGGLGIGLALSQRLVQLQGGLIEAKSDGPGQGSVFIVRLPLSPAPTEDIGQPGDQHAAPHEPDGLRVLVVDDNVDHVMLVATVLKRKGYSVQFAYDGHAALEVARQWRPNVVLLDIGLPGIDGYEVARRIRSDSELDLKHVRLIALSGYGRDSDILESQRAGFDGHLVKPFEFEELEKMIVALDAKAK